jgi:hypothetical protein
MNRETEKADVRAMGSDPSALTTQQLWREVQNLKELLETRIDGQLETRIDGIEKAIQVAHDDLVRVPTDVQKQVGNLKELHEQRFDGEAALRDEKFASVQKQFDGNKTAVDAALAAVKEAGNKTEAGFTKQIDQLTTLFQTGINGIDGQINDLKARFDRGEGRGEGTKESKTAQQDTGKYIIAVILALIAVFSFIAGRGGI